MKKTLIALATLAAAGTAFAQSTVTLSGTMDFAAASVGGSQANVKGTSVTQNLGVASTSSINFIAVEDLGGGLRATAQYALDPRGFATDNTQITRNETFLGLSGGFGNIRLGSPNSIGLTTFLTASPLGTGIGSGLSQAMQDYAFVRHSRSVRWDSPAMNGFTVSALHAPGNDQVVATGAPAQIIPNGRAVTEIGLRYAKGPLTVAFANVAQAGQTNTAAAKTSSNSLAVSYRAGATTLSAGMNDGDALTSTVTTAAQKSNGSRVGIAHTMGAVSLLASYATQETNLVKESVTGLRADYALSKRTVAYVGFEDWDNTKAVASATVNRGDRKITSIGLRHNF